MAEYTIRPGDTFYRLAQRMGGSCEDFIQCNPGINPECLQVGQKIVLPEFKTSKGREQYAEVSLEQGSEYAGDHLDDVEMEIEGVSFRVKRIGESKIPHEIHLLLPRTEIRKIQPQGENGPCEVQIMISNANIIHSPRLMSEGGGTTGAGRVEMQQKSIPSGQLSITRTEQEAGSLARVGELQYDVRPGQPPGMK